MPRARLHPRGVQSPIAADFSRQALCIQGLLCDLVTLEEAKQRILACIGEFPPLQSRYAERELLAIEPVRRRVSGCCTGQRSLGDRWNAACLACPHARGRRSRSEFAAPISGPN